MRFALFLTAPLALFFDIFLNSTISFKIYSGILAMIFLVSKKENGKSFKFGLYYGFFNELISHITPFGSMIIFNSVFGAFLSKIGKIFTDQASPIIIPVYLFLASLCYYTAMSFWQYSIIYLFSSISPELNQVINFKHLLAQTAVTFGIGILWIIFAKIFKKAFKKWFFVK